DVRRVAARVDAEGDVAAPERRRQLAPDIRARGARLLGVRVDLLRGAEVEGERHPAPAGGVLDAAVLRELRTIPEREHHLAGLEEDDVVLGARASLPAERFVEAAGTGKVAHAEGDDADSLPHGR